MTQDTKFYALQGGLDLVTPAIRMPQGHSIAGVNYECVEKGYGRVEGYERYDGHAKPSAASYWVLAFDAGTATIAAGATVTGLVSGATGIAVVNMIVDSGSFGSSNAVGRLILFNVAGTFADNEALRVGGVTKATANLTAVKRGAANDTDDATWYRAAIEATRAFIAAVPGSGPVRGVVTHLGVTYAFRDNAGATAGVMYKATATGWVAQALGRTLAFTAGTREINEGDTVTGGTSAAHAVVTRVVKLTGDWTTHDAVGYVVFSSQTGTFASETLKVGANNVATIAADSVATTLGAGGRYECVSHNFYGASNLKRLYGCNGVDRAFEWDASGVFTPITTGMVVDKPIHLYVHKEQLMLAFPGGSSQNSGVGTPLDWEVIVGAGEIAIGEEITGYGLDVSGGLAIFGKHKINVLYGNDSSDFTLQPVGKDAGSVEWTLQEVGNLTYLDEGGLRDLRSTSQFANFHYGTLTDLVDPLLRKKKKAKVSVLASVVCKTKTQYRLFWSDGTGLSTYLGRKTPEHGYFDLGKPVRCACNGEDADGAEVMFFGSDDGFVYQLDAGTSFDGVAVNAYLRLAFNHVGSPGYDKRWHGAVLEVDASPAVTLAMVAEFGYGDPEQASSATEEFIVAGGGGFWDETNWDEFYWSQTVEGQARADLEGSGENVSITVISTQVYESPHILHGLTLRFTLRKLKR